MHVLSENGKGLLKRSSFSGPGQLLEARRGSCCFRYGKICKHPFEGVGDACCLGRVFASDGVLKRLQMAGELILENRQ